jgi:DNA-binding CsgD family transcriptional regulator
MANERATLALIDDLYTAAETPGHWPRFLDRLADTLHCGMTVLFYQDVRDQSASVMATTRISAEDVRRYGDYYAARNPYFLEGKDLIRTGALIDDSMYDRRMLRGSEYYNDYLAPLSANHTAALVLAKEDGIAAMLSTFRSSRRGAYRRHELGMLHALRPHLQRAFRVHRRLFGPALRGDFSAAALDLIGTGVILVDAGGTIIQMNASAEAIIRSNDGVTTSRRRLQLPTSSDNRRLSRMIASAAEPARHPDGGEALLIVERPSGARSYSVVVAPVPYERAAKVVAILITEPRRHDPTSETLRSKYGLTGQEARVATALLTGQTIRDIAESFGIGIGTVRTHVKRVLSKTGVHRQAELIRLLTGS